MLQFLLIRHFAQRAGRNAHVHHAGLCVPVTTAPAAMKLSSATTTPGRRTAPPPTRAPRFTLGPEMYLKRSSVRPIK